MGNYVNEWGELLSDYEPPAREHVEEPEGPKLGTAKHGKLDSAPS